MLFLWTLFWASLLGGEYQHPQPFSPRTSASSSLRTPSLQDLGKLSSAVASAGLHQSEAQVTVHKRQHLLNQQLETQAGVDATVLRQKFFFSKKSQVCALRPPADREDHGLYGSQLTVRCSHFLPEVWSHSWICVCLDAWVL